MTLDADYLRRTMAAVLSVLHHASCPQNIFFHFIAATPPSSPLSAAFPYLRFCVYHFDGAVVVSLISVFIRSALDCPVNYARTYLADLLPAAACCVVYLDSDSSSLTISPTSPPRRSPPAESSPRRSTAEPTSPLTSRRRSGPAPPSPPPRSSIGVSAISTPASRSSTSASGAAVDTPEILNTGWMWGWILCRKPTFVADLEMNEEESAGLPQTCHKPT